jgi:hypothetical protein
MRRASLLLVFGILCASVAFADVSLVEHHATRNQLSHAGKKGPRPRPGGATGSVQLTDQQGLVYFINTNITFSTTSSASAAMSEASYNHSVSASTISGGITLSQLNDAYDGYQTMCLSLNNTIANCETGNANFVIFNMTRTPASLDASCPDPTGGPMLRQVLFPNQTSGNIRMTRKVFVPSNDSFARWLNYFTNTGSTPQTVTMMVANNLGSDSNTIITGDSQGNTTPDATSSWITSFQNWAVDTSSDVRLGHVLQQPGAEVQLAGLHFVDGNDNPYWGYTFTLNPGQTKILMNFAANAPTKAAAAAKAAELVTLPPNATQCLSDADRQEIVNFNADPPIGSVPTLSTAGLSALGLLLAAAAVVIVRRRQTTSAGI